MKIRNALIFTTAVAASLSIAACNQSPGSYYADNDVSVCTDRIGHRVDDSFCRQRTVGYVPYYLGSGSYVPPYGSRIVGGSRTPYVGHSYVSSSVGETIAVSRGGFGTSARGGSFGGGFSAGE